jgi:hypothetical protein
MKTQILLLAGALACPWAAHAQPAQPAAPASEGPSALQAAAIAAEAKELNKNGIAMLDASDFERALDYFLRSRAVLATTKNTTNAAITLERLGRFDESLELYEELLLKYAGGLDDEDRAAIGPAMEALRQKVGSVEVSSNVGGTVFIDGRARGRLPLNTPLRVLAGKHTVRVTRVGFQEFESTFTVEAAKSAGVDAKLQPLKGVGQVLVQDVGGAKADVYVDGVKLGTTPWEASLPPGKHLIWLRDGESRGSLPTWVQVIDGQAALTQLSTRPLGPELTLRVVPRTATFEVEGVELGKGSWQGRLPVGSYKIAASEPGYFGTAQRLEVSPTKDGKEVTLELKVDASHPRWPRAAGAFVADVFGGPMLGPSLNGGYEDDCPDRCESSSVPFGFQVGARAGYRFPFRMAIELGAGYMSLRQTVERTETATFDAVPGESPTTVRYDLVDDVHVHGPFVGVGLSWRAELGRFYLGTRASAGVLVASARDPISGTARTNGESVAVFAQKNNDSVLSPAPYVAPEAIGGVRVGPLDIGIGLGVTFFPANGPVVERGRFGAVTQEGIADPTAVQNSPESKVIDGERAFGRFFMFSPTVNVGAAF